MIPNHDRLVAGPRANDPHLVKANADTKHVFQTGAFEWEWILDLPGGPKGPQGRVYRGELGKVTPQDFAEVVYVSESGGSFQTTIVDWDSIKGADAGSRNVRPMARAHSVEDPRVELQPLVIRPQGYRRLLKVAWAYDLPIEMHRISLSKAGIIAKEKFSRIAPPGDPTQPFAFKRTCPFPIAMFRMWIVTWESPYVITGTSAAKRVRVTDH